MKFRPGVVPQWPSSRGLTCSGSQRLAQQRIVEQIDLADREVVRRAPVGVEPIEAGICRHFTQFGEWATLGHCANAIPFRTGPATVSQDSGRAITPVAWELKR